LGLIANYFFDEAIEGSPSSIFLAAFWKFDDVISRWDFSTDATQFEYDRR
jgi:hypothetical protein